MPQDPKKPATNAEPTDEVYTLRIGLKDAHWSQEKSPGGSEKPCARTQHTAIGISDKELFVFGGHTTDSESANGIKNLNDAYVLNTGNMEWRSPVNDNSHGKCEMAIEDNKNEESQDNDQEINGGDTVPHPRANSA